MQASLGSLSPNLGQAAGSARSKAPLPRTAAVISPFGGLWSRIHSVCSSRWLSLHNDCDVCGAEAKSQEYPLSSPLTVASGRAAGGAASAVTTSPTHSTMSPASSSPPAAASQTASSVGGVSAAALARTMGMMLHAANNARAKAATSSPVALAVHGRSPGTLLTLHCDAPVAEHRRCSLMHCVYTEPGASSSSSVPDNASSPGNARMAVRVALRV